MATPSINKGTFSAKTTGTPDSVDVSLPLFGQVIVYHQVNLLHVDAPGKQVSRDQNSEASSSELLHNQFTLIQVHAPVQDRDHETLIPELFRQIVNLLLVIGKNRALLNLQILVQFHQSQKLPLLLVDGDVELFDTVQGQFFVFYEDCGWVPHEFFSNF